MSIDISGKMSKFFVYEEKYRQKLTVSCHKMSKFVVLKEKFHGKEFV